MPVTHKIPVPKVKHFGYYRDINMGFRSITDKENMPQPEKTRLTMGSVAGSISDARHNNLYCFSDGRQDELIVTLYEQLSKSGEIVYLHEKMPEAFDYISRFINKFDSARPRRFFATFTGGNALCTSRLADIVTQKLKRFNFQSVVWNTWAWLPNHLSLCGTNCYVVRLDLINGHVKSFATSFHEINNLVCRSGFLDRNRDVMRASSESWLKTWFEQNPCYVGYRSRAILLAQKNPAIYSMQLLMSVTGSKAYIILSYVKNRKYSDINAVFSDHSTDVLIMLPDAEYELPKGPEKSTPPSQQPQTFANNPPVTSPRQRHQGKKAPVTPLQEKPLITPPQRSEYVVQESELFYEQKNLLSSYYGTEAMQTISRIEIIKADLTAGRLPTKSVEKYYVCDLPALSRNKGRGAWRLLITRQLNVLTLYAIADYHGGTWKQWG